MYHYDVVKQSLNDKVCTFLLINLQLSAFHSCSDDQSELTRDETTSDIIFQIKDLLYSKAQTLSHYCGKVLVT